MVVLLSTSAVLAQVESGRFTLPRFVIGVADATAYSAPLIAVLDHEGNFYPQCCGTGIVAFTGEAAPRGDSTEFCPVAADSPQCFFTPGCVCGYEHPEGRSYVLTGNYVGALRGARFLSYDGHAGYDYRYATGTPIVAPRSGLLCKAVRDPINGSQGASSAWGRFHTFFIDHGDFGDGGYATWYLHADDLTGVAANGRTLVELGVGECAPVDAGQVVATVGAFGTLAPHLHFEVRRYPLGGSPEDQRAVGIDPYGWSGPGDDPIANNPQADVQLEPLWVDEEIPGVPGDCRGDGEVTIDEIVRSVAIALGELPVEACNNADADGNGAVTVDEILQAVVVALGGAVTPD